MSSRDSERRRLDRLLSQDPGPSVQEKEDMLQGILGEDPASTKAPRTEEKREHPPFVWWLPVAAVAGVFGILLLVLFVVPTPERLDPLSRGEVAEGEGTNFQPRGSGQGQAPQMQLRCQAGTPVQPTGEISCPQGQNLIFELQPASHSTSPSWFSAAALGAQGVLIWYFPASATQDQSLALPPKTVTRRTVALGPEHKAGHYQLYGFFHQSPATKKELKELIEAHQTGQAINSPIVLQSLGLKVSSP